MTFLDIDITTRILRKLCAHLCDFVYWLIAKIYELFITVARLNILSDGLGPIYQRVTMMLTIVMTFYITFEFVKYTIQPDNFTDSEKGAGNILKRIVIVVALIAFMPNIFSLAYDLQSRIIETNLISKIILGTADTDYTKFGNDFSANTLELFYYYDEEVCAGGGGKCDDAKAAVEENLTAIREKGEVNISDTINLESSSNILHIGKETYPAINFTFSGLLPLIIGIFIAYILVMYSIDVGVRYAQLIFLQAMAPIAIMGYILPKKDGIFQKWGRQCITTYLDLFLRLIIINFVLLLTKVLGEAFSSTNGVGTIFEGMGNISPGLKMFVYIVLVLGLLVFAQRAPKLLGELFPSIGGAGGIGFGLSGKERFDNIKKSFGGLTGIAKAPYNVGKKVVGGAGRVVGGVGGAIAGAAVGTGVRGKLRTAVTGAKEGASKDNKGLRRIERAREAARQRVYKEDEIERSVPAGVSREEAIREATYHKERWANRAAEYERQSKLFDVAGGSLDNINKQIEEFKQIKAIKAELKAAEARGDSAGEIKTIDAKLKRTMQEMRRAINANGGRITDDMLNSTNFIEVEYDKLDDNGFKTGIKLKNKVMYDEGDRNFSYSTNQTAHNEFLKMQAASRELNYIAQAKVTINGTEMTVEKWLQQPNAENIYAEFTNKFKDAMVEQKTKYENEPDYQRAQAYKNGIGDSGGKK